MANYNCTAKTNYFRVKDEEAYKRLFESLTSDEDYVYDLTKEIKGEVYHAFGAYGTIGVNDPDGEIIDFDLMISEISKLLTDDSVFTYVESGNEKLRYIDGFACVCTNKQTTAISLDSWINETIENLVKVV